MAAEIVHEYSISALESLKQPFTSSDWNQREQHHRPTDSVLIAYTSKTTAKTNRSHVVFDPTAKFTP